MMILPMQIDSATLDEISRRILTSEIMDDLRAPLEDARALPNAAYTDPDFLALENARLFAPGWVLARVWPPYP